MRPFERTVTTEKIFNEAVSTIEKTTAEKGFRVLHTHDVAATLGEKGFPQEPLKIIEICNAKYASQVLDKDVRISLMLPCPISIYVKGGKTNISTLLPTSIAEFFPQAGIESLASEVERIVLSIVECLYERATDVTKFTKPNCYAHSEPVAAREIPSTFS